MWDKSKTSKTNRIYIACLEEYTYLNYIQELNETNKELRFCKYK